MFKSVLAVNYNLLVVLNEGWFLQLKLMMIFTFLHILSKRQINQLLFDANPNGLSLVQLNIFPSLQSVSFAFMITTSFLILDKSLDLLYNCNLLKSKYQLYS